MVYHLYHADKLLVVVECKYSGGSTNNKGIERILMMKLDIYCNHEITVNDQVWSTDWGKQPAPSEDVLLDGGQSLSLKQAKP